MLTIKLNNIYEDEFDVSFLEIKNTSKPSGTTSYLGIGFENDVLESGSVYKIGFRYGFANQSGNGAVQSTSTNTLYCSSGAANDEVGAIV